jgi:N-acetylglucosaminyl-diphospho-decaprenol L-rhamnosyltransferase
VSQPPLVSVVIVSYNTRDELLRCLESLRAVTVPLQTLVVDNASGDGSAAAARAAFPAARVLENPENVGFAAASNRGLREAGAELVLLLNSDAEVRPGAVEALVEVLRGRPDVAIVGPRTVGSDGRPQVSFGPDLTPWSEWGQARLVRGVREGRPDAMRQAAALSAGEREVDWVSGSCLMARRRVLQDVGFFDEAFFLYEEDADLCRRVRHAGHKVLYSPRAEVLHHLGRSMEKAPARARHEYDRSHLAYYRKHNPAWQSGLLRIYLFLRKLGRQSTVDSRQ